ncbi:hypothetical protein ACISU4_01245 [Streptomyces wuyuanensis]|uniref:hypothetical protein n=1 Tax=Streptomyces wuyuanensis TaxID=1196353 RepID=UPI0037F8BBAE
MSKFVPPVVAGRVPSRPAAASARPPFLADYREADREVYERLRSAGFQGPEQQVVESRVVEYAWRLLNTWMVTGEIFNRVKAVNRPVPTDPAARERLLTDAEARSDLAADTVLAALPVFRAQLAEGRWDSKQATLTTYFIGAVILSFPNVYRSWLRRSAHEVRVSALGVTPEELSPGDLPRAEDDVSSSVESNETVAAFLKMLKSPDREMAQMLAEGKSIAEISHRFNVTRKAVQQRLRRLANKAAAAGLV